MPAASSATCAYEVNCVTDAVLPADWAYPSTRTATSRTNMV